MLRRKGYQNPDHTRKPHRDTSPKEERGRGDEATRRTNILRIISVPILVTPLRTVARGERDGGDAAADGDVGCAEGSGEGEYCASEASEGGAKERSYASSERRKGTSQPTAATNECEERDEQRVR